MQQTTQYAILAEDVDKQYKNGVQALSGLSLSVKRGEIFTLLGENGAGKSTLIRILTTFLRPDSGRISVLDRDLHRHAEKYAPVLPVFPSRLPLILICHSKKI